MDELAKPQSIGGFGTAGDQVLDDIVATILDITVKAWSRLVARGKVGPSHHEKQISDELRWQMDAEKKGRDPVPQLRFEREPQSDVPDREFGLGEIDVYVIYSFEQSEYFAMECKRLAAADSALSLAYVTDGVSRFVTCKYSHGHAYGAMVGYVCLGRSEEVSRQLQKRITEHDVNETALDLDWSWRREERFGAVPHLFSTKHRQARLDSEILLLHLLLDFAS